MRRSALIVGLVGSAALAAASSASVIFSCQILAFDTATGQPLGDHTWTFNLPANWGLNDTVSAGWGEYQFGPDNALPGEYAGALDLGGGNKVHGVGISFRNDPQVTLNFNVAANPISNTTFVVNSAIVNFPSILTPVGYASAFIGVTDSAGLGTPGQISLTGLQPGGTAYSALYNPSLTGFANLITGAALNVAPGSSTAFTDNLGSAGSPVPIGTSITEIRSQFRFALSTADRAAGTSVFDVAPTPGAASVLGLGGLLFARRRRS